MVWERILPFVQCRIEIGDDALLPFLVSMTELGSRFICRILSKNGFQSQGRL